MQIYLQKSLINLNFETKNGGNAWGTRMKLRKKDETADPMSRCPNTIRAQWTKKATHKYAAHKRYTSIGRVTGGAASFTASCYVT